MGTAFTVTAKVDVTAAPELSVSVIVAVATPVVANTGKLIVLVPSIPEAALKVTPEMGRRAVLEEPVVLNTNDTREPPTATVVVCAAAVAVVVMAVIAPMDVATIQLQQQQQRKQKSNEEYECVSIKW